MTAVLPIEALERGLAAAPAPRRTLDELIEATGLRSLVLGASKDPNAKVTVLLVAPATRRPVFAVKVPTTDAAAAVVEAEAALLSALHARDLGEVAETIPHLSELVSHDGRTAMVATALHGTPLTREYARPRHTASRARVAADFAAVEDWLRRFQAATRVSDAGAGAQRAVADELRDRFADDDAAARAAVLEARLSQDAPPATAVHGDLWFGNVLLSGEGRVTGVVDWEAAALMGDPMRDVVRFALGYALYLDRRTRPGKKVRGHDGLTAGAWGAPVEFALDGNGWFPELFARFIRDGLTRLGAAPDSWRDHVLAGIAEVAATADDLDFARRHLELFRRLTRRPDWRAAE